MNDLRRIAESSREAVKLIETLPTVCANRAFFPLPRLATCSCKTFRGRSNRMRQSLAFACLSYVGNDRKRGNNLLLKYENETPEAFFLISVKNVIHSAQPFPLRMGRGFLPLCRRIRKTRPSSQPPPSAFLLVGRSSRTASVRLFNTSMTCLRR